MPKIAFLFPGQGSQYPGMAKDVCLSFSSARTAFEEADQRLGFALSELCFRGPDEDLKLTHNTQPAILAASIAILKALEQAASVRPDYVAGHSLGEYSALVCAECLTLGDAVAVVRNRGRYMQEAVPLGAGMMAAVLGIDAKTVTEACADAREFGVVSAANFNSPDQTVISGETIAVRRASEIAKERGARRVLPLPVSAPFHCDLMAPARDRLEVELRKMEFRDLRTPLINNADAGEILRGSAARDALIRQVCSPVRWVESIRRMVGSGVSSFVEVGPGKVLSGLVRKIAPEVSVANVEDVRGIEALASGRPGVTM